VPEGDGHREPGEISGVARVSVFQARSETLRFPLLPEHQPEKLSAATPPALHHQNEEKHQGSTGSRPPATE